MALENLYFNTLDREKVQGKSLGCIKGWGDTYATRSHRRGMKESHVAREPRVADPCPRATKESVVSRGLMDRALDLKPEVTQGCGFESRLWQEVSTTEVRPLGKAPNPQLLPGCRNVGCPPSTWIG